MSGENTRVVLPAELTVTFDYPVSIKGEEVTELTIRKPKMKDMLNGEKVQGSDIDKEMWMVSALTGATIDDLKNLDKDQYELIQEQWVKYAASSIALF